MEPNQTGKAQAGSAANPPGAWLFVYFRQIYPGRVEIGPEGMYEVPLTTERLAVEQPHYAVSQDGLHWTALNDNRPIAPETFGAWKVRDPFVGRGHDGRFHMVATGGGRRHMLHAASDDLIHWDAPAAAPVMESVPDARNVWAPEWFADEQAGDYLVFWSSSHGREGWDDSRIWGARTTDFRSFSAPRVLCDPGFTVIDATITPHDGGYVMFLKDERFGFRHGERRRIHVARAGALDGPYALAREAVTPTITEGPAVLSVSPGRWLLLYDHCMDNRYGASVSTDLLQWEPVEDVAFPPNARHGSVVRITVAEWEALQRRFGSPDGPSGAVGGV